MIGREPFDYIYFRPVLGRTKLSRELIDFCNIEFTVILHRTNFVKGRRVAWLWIQDSSSVVISS